MGYVAYYVAPGALKARRQARSAAVKAALPSVTYEALSAPIAFDEIPRRILDTVYTRLADKPMQAWTLDTVRPFAAELVPTPGGGATHRQRGSCFAGGRVRKQPSLSPDPFRDVLTCK